MSDRSLIPESSVGILSKAPFDIHQPRRYILLVPGVPSKRTDIAFFLFGCLTFVCLAASLSLIFFFAPTEAQMGIVQKIFYFHVGSAYAMYIGLAAASVGGLLYLIKRDEKWDALGVAGAETGLMFCAAVLISGPLWARKAWGLYWVWDPRLTTTLLGGLMLAAYAGLRSFGQAGTVEKRFASMLAVATIPNAVLIHYSVKRWAGQHPVVVSKGGGGLHPDMQIVFGLTMLTFTLFAIWLIWLRTRVERDAMRADFLRYELQRTVHANDLE